MMKRIDCAEKHLSWLLIISRSPLLEVSTGWEELKMSVQSWRALQKECSRWFLGRGQWAMRWMIGVGCSWASQAYLWGRKRVGQGCTKVVVMLRKKCVRKLYFSFFFSNATWRPLLDQLVTLFTGTLGDELEHLSKSRLGWQGSQPSREREREREILCMENLREMMCRWLSFCVKAKWNCAQSLTKLCTKS